MEPARQTAKVLASPTDTLWIHPKGRMSQVKLWIKVSVMVLSPVSLQQRGTHTQTSLRQVSGHGDKPHGSLTLVWAGRRLRLQLSLGSALTGHMALDEHLPALSWASLWGTGHMAKPTGQL